MIDVLAIDPSLRSTGYAVNRGDTIDHGRIIPLPPHTRGPARNIWIAAQIRQRIRHHRPQLIAIEGLYVGGYAGATVSLARLRGVIEALIHGEHIPLIEVAPKTLKMWATNNGNADKNTMIAAAHDLTSYRGRNPDEADATLLHALIADATGLPYTDGPYHDRRDQALAPVVNDLARINILDPDRTPQEQ